MTGAPPSARVLAAFRTSGPPERLAGGQERSWRAGDVVLKPLDGAPEVLEWLDAVVAPRVNDARIRVSLPLRSRSGELVVDGWTAARYLPGRHEPRWREIAVVGGVFAELLDGVPRPGFLDARDDPWALADRLAWGDVDDDVARVPYVSDLLAAAAPVDEASGLVHGDLSGNVLFSDDGKPPALLDLSLYWRPSAYASAVVAVDAVCWHGAPLDLLAELSPDVRYLVRALLFRLLAEHLCGRPVHDVGFAAYAPCADRVLRLAATL